MNAIPKALVMANPKHVVACVATAAGLISSKFAIDAAGNETDYANIDIDGRQYDQPVETEEHKCAHAYLDCEKELEECT